MNESEDNMPTYEWTRTDPTMPRATKSTRTGATRYGAHYRVEMSDGRVLTMSVPAAECRECGGTGKRWNDAADRFEDAACPACKGDGLAR